MKTDNLPSFVVAASLGLIVLSSRASGGHFSYSQVDMVGYAYAGEVFPNGWFQTNLVVVQANTLTNLGASGRSGYSTNELLLQLGSNSIAGKQVFEFVSGGRGSSAPRGGLIARDVTFRVEGRALEVKGGAWPFLLNMQTAPELDFSLYKHGEIRVALCEWNDNQTACTNVVSAVVTNWGLSSMANNLILKLGQQYRLTCLLAAAAPRNPGSGLFVGTNHFSLEPSVMVSIAMSEGQTRLCVKGWPGRRYALERSSDLSAWQPLMTNSAPSGAFEYVDETAANAPSRFYRAVEQP
jgi:hypothetical protein